MTDKDFGRLLVLYFAWVVFCMGMAVLFSFLVFTPEPSEDLPPCKYEDSQHCYWDADTMGNGQGHDVVNR